ncbi:MAG: hypothetical protein ACR2NU_01735 [Aeoliella sp.]
MSFVFAAALIAVPGCGWAQEPEADNSTKAPPAEGANGDEAEPAPAESAAPIDPRDAKIHELTSRIAAMETEIESLKANLKAIDGQLVNLVDPDELSRQALGAMAENSQLRSGLGQMLQGKVRLVNETGAPEVVYINGTPWTVVVGESYVYSPVGTVSFLREGYEEPTFMGVQEWYEDEETALFELEYLLPAVGDEDGPTAIESSVLKPLPERAAH